MQSYPQTNLSGGKRIFNYRLTKMLRISKNVCAIWGSRFRVFTTAMALAPKKAVTITLETVVLYNMLQTKGRLLCTNENALDRENKDESVTKENWKSVGENILVKIFKNKNNHAQKLVEKVREAFAHHLMSSALSHGSGMYYCEQNRNDILQTSKLN